MLAIYHLTANVISRARGHSVVAAAAYRSGTRLRDERYGAIHDYSVKRGAAHSEIMAPSIGPDWAREREMLWNRVEACERRKDSQLARAIELSLPRELTAAQRLALVRDYVARTFVSHGMIADVSLRLDHPVNPLAQILLTLRELTSEGFGRKARQWNDKRKLIEWRSAWADLANEHLARAGHQARIDHRTLDAQQIELTPSRRVGAGLARDATLPVHLRDRLRDQHRIACENGIAILADPFLALAALAQGSPIFTQQDIESFLRSRTGEEQFAAACQAVMQCDALIPLSQPGDEGARCFTSRDVVEAAKSLRQRARSMASRRAHGITPLARASFGRWPAVTQEQAFAFDYLSGEGDAKALAVPAHAKGALLSAARSAWEFDGLRVVGMTLSQTAADELQAATGIASRTLERHEEAWRGGGDLITRAAVLVIDAADSLPVKPLERMFAVADKARAKVVAVGDPERLRAMRVAPPFRDVLRELSVDAGPGTLS